MKSSPRIFILFALLLICFSTSAAFSETKVAGDPSRLSVGARSLGMGKAFTGLADDVTSMFLNPAGLGNISNWQFTSMSGKFINEINYVSIAGVYPTRYGCFGIGYIGSDLGFTGPVVVSTEVGGEIHYLPATQGAVSYSYNNAVLLLSYGAPFSQLTENPYLQNVSFGLNLKIFSQGLTGTGLSGGAASGYDMDLGLLYKAYPWLSLGLNQQNTLPASMGGKIVWPANGTTRLTAVEEVIPSKTKLGSSLKLGRDGGLLEDRLGNHLVNVNLDMDMNLMSENTGSVPMLMHFGVEWWPVEYGALRAGVDQDVVGSSPSDIGTSNNLTFGVGLFYNDFRFDYAYHQYNAIPENDTHYFSISYGIPNAPKKKQDEFIVVDVPKDKSIVYDRKVTLAGRTLSPDVSFISVNKQEVPAKNATFTTEITLEVGANTIELKPRDFKGMPFKSYEHHISRLLTFKDVQKGYWAKIPIEALATLSIINGYPDKTFKPDGPITRAELTTLLVKAKWSSLSTLVEKPLFKDVPNTYWAAGYINQAIKMGIIQGYPDKTFRPQSKISRVEALMVISRFGGLVPQETLTTGPYPDLPGRHWAAKMIASAKSAGYLRYLAGNPLQPNKDFTRAEAAEVLSKTSFISGQINKLLFIEEGEKLPAQ